MCRKKVAIMKYEHWRKGENGLVLQKMALSAKQTHGLIPHSVTATKRNLVVVGLNQDNWINSTLCSYFYLNKLSVVNTMKNFPTYSTQFAFKSKTCTWERGYGCHWSLQKSPLWERIYGITWTHTILTFMFIFNRKKIFYAIDNLAFKLYIISFLRKLLYFAFHSLFLEVLIILIYSLLLVSTLRIYNLQLVLSFLFTYFQPEQTISNDQCSNDVNLRV